MLSSDASLMLSKDCGGHPLEQLMITLLKLRVGTGIYFKLKKMPISL
jgi:hypothetical protein